MSSAPELPRERAIKQVIQELIDKGVTEARSLKIAMIAEDNEEIEYTLTPKRVGQFLQNNRDLGFVTIEKRSQEFGPTMWEFEPKE